MCVFNRCWFDYVLHAIQYFTARRSEHYKNKPNILRNTNEKKNRNQGNMQTKVIIKMYVTYHRKILNVMYTYQ